MSQLKRQAAANIDVVKLAKGAGVTLVGKMTGRTVSALAQIMLARLLGPEAFGLYAIGWTIVRIAGAIAPLGLDKGVIRYGSRYLHTDLSRFKGVLFQSISLAMLSGALVGLCLYFAAPWLAEQVFKKPGLVLVIYLFAPAPLFYSGLRVAAAATRIPQKMQYSVYSEEVLQPFTNLCLVLIFFMLGWKLSSSIVACVVSFAIAFVLALYYISHLFPEVFSHQIKLISATRELLVFSLSTSFAGIFMMLNFWIDRLMVGYFLPAAEVGIYQAVSQLSFLLGIIVAAFNTALAPMIVDFYHKGQMQQLDELFKMSTKWGVYLCLPLFLVMILAPHGIMTTIFGKEYESGALPLIILVVAQLINVATGAVDYLLIMTGQQNRWLLISVVMLFSNITLDWFLIPKLGITGAALGTAGALIGLFLLGLFQVKYSLKVWPYDKKFFKGIVAAILTAGILFLVHETIGGAPVLDLLLVTIVSVFVFGIVLVMLGLSPEDWEFISLIRMRPGRKRD